jgi:hypothetical protein
VSKLAASLALVFLAAPSAAGPLQPTRASQLVTAYGGADAPAACGATVFSRVDKIGNPDGSSASFVIPPKSVFVITDIAVSGSGGTPGNLATVSVLAVDPANPPAPGAIGAHAAASGVIDPIGNFQGTATIPNGLVVKSPALLCYTSVTPSVSVIAHGYFAKDK